MDNYRILGKSVEIKVSSKMAGYKMNLPFNAVNYKKYLTLLKNGCIVYSEKQRRYELFIVPFSFTKKINDAMHF